MNSSKVSISAKSVNPLEGAESQSKCIYSSSFGMEVGFLLLRSGPNSDYLLLLFGFLPKRGIRGVMPKMSTSLLVGEKKALELFRFS